MEVLLLIGSDSDLEKVKPAYRTLIDFGIKVESHVCSAHRSPDKATQLSLLAHTNGFKVIICAAGMAAHLAGVVASHTILPVIGLPLSGSALGGQDALYSTVQMPSGIPVATVAVDGAQNAAILAIQILALSNSNLTKNLWVYKESLKEKVETADANLQSKLADFK